MKPKSCDYLFSPPFDALISFGAWEIETSNPMLKRFHPYYRVFCFSILVISMILQLLDLFQAIGDFNETAYNLSTSMIVVATSVKVVIIWFKRRYLIKLRKNLKNDYFKCEDDEDLAIREAALNDMKLITRIMHLSWAVVLAYWSSAYFSYLWGRRELPFPAYIPVNLDDPLEYHLVFVFEMFCSTYLVIIAIEIDLAMFSLVFQISAQFKILSKNILCLNKLYNEGETTNEKPETNFFLKRRKTEGILKKLVNRQLEIVEYVNLFESVYNLFYFVQIFLGSSLIIMNGFQLMRIKDSKNNPKYLHEFAFLCAIVVDIFFICYYVSGLTVECTNVGHSAYGTPWYLMDNGLRKLLLMIILRSQRPPKVTSAKFFSINLSTYLSMLKNIYSWLMLFRQVDTKGMSHLKK